LNSRVPVPRTRSPPPRTLSRHPFGMVPTPHSRSIASFASRSASYSYPQTHARPKTSLTANHGLGLVVERLKSGSSLVDAVQLLSHQLGIANQPSAPAVVLQEYLSAPSSPLYSHVVGFVPMYSSVRDTLAGRIRDGDAVTGRPGLPVRLRRCGQGCIAPGGSVSRSQ